MRLTYLKALTLNTFLPARLLQGSLEVQICRWAVKKYIHVKYIPH